ncbi:MAG TPA: hypothetical protein VF605_08580 [Allosphingosinicella sp.]|jgi:hypothetical protein
MMKFLLGVVVGYVAREEIRRVIKETVKTAVALREDVVDAVAEQRSASPKAD